MMRKLFSFWTDMDEGKKSLIVKITGVLTGIFALFALISCVSYLFTWKADQSLLQADSLSETFKDIRNLAGIAGYRFAHLVMGRWFGLGAFALVFAFGVLSLRMLFGKQKFSIVRAVLLSFVAALIMSVAFAFASTVFDDNLLDGGLGGGFGALLCTWTVGLFGNILTIVILAALIALWFVFASRKFGVWFNSLGNSGVDDKSESQPAEELENEQEDKKPERKKKIFTWGSKVPGREDSGLNSDSIASDADGAEKAAPVPDPGGYGVAGLRAESGDSAGNDSVSVNPAAVPTENGIEVVDDVELSTDVDKELPWIDVRQELEKYQFPSLDLLEDYESSRQKVSYDEMQRNNIKIRATLKTYKIDIVNVTVEVGPTVTLYKVYPAPGVKSAAIRNLQDDIAMALHAKGVRIILLTDSVGIEVANDNPSVVPLKAMLNSDEFRNSKAELPVAIGYSITQKVKVFDLADAPHLLVAGATKQGKSVGLNVLITSLLYAKHPSELKFVFIDPKMVEFSAYARLLNHYLAILPDAADEAETRANAIVKKAKPAEEVLRSLCREMDMRYELMSDAMVNQLKLYNDKFRERKLLPSKGHHYLPYIVVVIDEYADLTMSVAGGGEAKNMAKSITTSIIRLAQKGRAAGIHVVLATQRPSVDVITGLIKTNFPSRIAFRTVTRVDSSTILDSPGAEKLIGRGDMLYFDGTDIKRMQCAYIANDEISRVTKFIGDQQGYKKSYQNAYYLPAPEPTQAEDGSPLVDIKNLDERFEESARLVVTNQRASTSDLQRRLNMGFAKAGRVMDQLQAAGIVGPQEGSKPRQVLVQTMDELDKILEAYLNQ